jgi:hypothetical protein
MYNTVEQSLGIMPSKQSFWAARPRCTSATDGQRLIAAALQAGTNLCVRVAVPISEPVWTRWNRETSGP